MTDKYLEAVNLIADRKDATDVLAEAERIEKDVIKDNPVNIFYSDKKEEIISYRQYVMEVQSDADDFLFALAGNKGETIASLKKKSVSDLMSFAERLTNG